MGSPEMDEDYVNRVVVDMQTRSVHLYSDEGDCKTIDCSDDYEGFLRVVELCRTQAAAETVYAPLEVKN